MPKPPAPGSLPNRHAQKLKCPQVHPPGPLPEQQMNGDRHGHRRGRGQKPKMNDTQAQVWHPRESQDALEGRWRCARSNGSTPAGFSTE